MKQLAICVLIVAVLAIFVVVLSSLNAPEPVIMAPGAPGYLNEVPGLDKI